MAFIKWDPFEDLLDLQKSINNLFSTQARRRKGAKKSEEADFVPSVDIWEDDHDIHLEVSVPGAEKGGLDVTLTQDVLVVSGEVREAEAKARGKIYKRERQTGKFLREFTVYDGLKPDAIRADFKDGVLTVSFPKPSAVEPETTQIQIK